MSTKNKVFLASGSPRRLELLKNLSCCVAQIRVPYIEPKVANFKDPYRFMGRCIEDKFHQAQQWFIDAKEIHNAPSLEGQILLVADTVVTLGSEILGKPLDKIDAFKTLAKLSGKSHRVFTAYRLWITCAQPRPPQFLWSRTVVSTVRFKKPQQDFLTSYIRSGEPLDKAGAYGVQGPGLQLIESLEGSYSSVMGLPLCELLTDLKDLERRTGMKVLEA